MIGIPPSIQMFAEHFAKYLTPNARASGWQELETEVRGSGDFMDLVGSLMIFDMIAAEGRVCRMDITCGDGDKSDIEVRVGGKWRKLNIKTSSYHPYRKGLNLYVKEEEADKDIDGYIQVFVHTKSGAGPHVHVSGWVSTSSDVWKEARKDVIEIPRTGGHKGVRVPVEKLQSIDKMIELVDRKF